jgi:transposase
MILIGVDYHPSVQQVAYVDTETGDICERRLNHSDGEAERFYRDLERRQVRVRVGIEATGHARWFERLLAELKFELWIGDPAEIKAARVRKQKTDRQDALLLLRLLVEDRFPQIWVPSPENRDLRQQLESLQLAPWATRRRQDLLELVDRLNRTIAELTAAVEQEAHKRPEVLRLMTHPGVGPITALAFVLVIGSPDRFACGKKIGSYLGLIPEEDSSANRQRLGHITKQGNSLVRYLLAEAAQAAVRSNSDWRRRYMHLSKRRERAIAKVTMARRLAVSLYWMWRKEYDYQQHLKFGSHAGEPGLVHGVK